MSSITMTTIYFQILAFVSRPAFTISWIGAGSGFWSSMARDTGSNSSSAISPNFSTVSHLK